MLLLLLAEKERFELSKPFWGLHDFQSCALDQARRLLHDRILSHIWLKRLIIVLALYFFVNQLCDTISRVSMTVRG